MIRYRFTDTARFKTSIESIWHEIIDVLSYPLWWTDMKKTIILGDEHLLQSGSKIYYEIKGFLPYTLKYVVEVVDIQPYSTIHLKSSGDLIGRGKFFLQRSEDQVEATFWWDVSLGTLFLRAISRISLFKRLLQKNHDYVMTNALNGLRVRIEK